MSQIRPIKRRLRRSQAVILRAAVVAPLAASTTAALSLLSSPAGAEPKPGAADQAPSSTGCAASSMALQSETAIPNGGERYDYVIAGTPASFTVPPPGFSPLTASDAALAEFGFPARPTDAPHLARWQTVMSSYRKTASPLTMAAETCSLDSAANNLAQRKTTSYTPPSATQSPEVSSAGTNPPSNNWSGYEADAPAGPSTWTGIIGSWTQPGAGACNCNNTSGATWVGLGGGLGGDGQQKLIQAGTAYNFTFTNGQNPAYGGFYEWVTPTQSIGGVEIPGMVINPGDAISAIVSWNGSAATFFVDDVTTGTAGPGGQFYVPNAYDGSSAEWIQERVSCGMNCYPPLVNFGSVTFGDLEVQVDGSSWKDLTTVSSSSVNQDWIYQDINNGQQMAGPDPLLSDNTFADVWFKCQ